MNKNTQTKLIDTAAREFSYGKDYMFLYNYNFNGQSIYFYVETCKELVLHYSARAEDCGDNFICCSKNTYLKVSEILDSYNLPKVETCLELKNCVFVNSKSISLAMVDLFYTLIKSFNLSDDLFQGIKKLYPRRGKATEIYKYYLENSENLLNIQDDDFARYKGSKKTRDCNQLGLLSYYTRKNKSTPKVQTQS